MHTPAASIPDRPDRTGDQAALPDAPGVPASPREPVARWRLVVHRTAADSGSDAKARQEELLRAVAASGLPLAGMDAEPARPRVVLAAPLPAGLEGLRELLECVLVVREPAWRVRTAVAAALPAGETLVEAHDVWLGAPALPGQVVASVYRIDLEPHPDSGAAGRPAEIAPLRAGIAEAAAAMLAATSLPRMRRKGDTSVPYELRTFLDDLAVLPPTPDIPGDPQGVGCTFAVRATLRHDPERGIGRPEEVAGELGDRIGVPLVVAGLVRERLVLAEDRPAPEPPPPPRHAIRRGAAARHGQRVRRPG